MKKLIKTLILGFFVLNFLYGEEGEIELVPVYEKTFPDTIVDVIFDTATVSIEEAKNLGWKVEVIPENEKKDGKMKISYLKVVFIGKKGFPEQQKMKFLDRYGNTIKIISGKGAERIIYSTNGKYILKALRYDSDRDSGGGAILFDNNGNVIWEKQEGVFRAVSDNGYTATGFISPEGSSYPFQIFDPTGKKIKEINLPDWGIFDAGVGANKEYFIFAFRGKAGFDSTGIMIVKETGEIIFDGILPGDILPDRVLSFSNERFIIIMLHGEKIEKTLRVIEIKKEMREWRIIQTPVSYFLGTSALVKINNTHYIYSIDRGYLVEWNVQDSKIKKLTKLPSELKFLNGEFFQIEGNRIKGFSFKKE